MIVLAVTINSQLQKTQLLPTFQLPPSELAYRKVAELHKVEVPVDSTTRNETRR